MKTYEASIFQTKIGWCAIVGAESTLVRVMFGERTRRTVVKRLDETLGTAIPLDWNPNLRKQLLLYCTGEQVDFSEVPVGLDGRTRFQRTVLRNCQRIPYGQRLTYGELAARSGSPRAARAVGSVMARNPIPLIIPCHRVIQSDGKLGGFTAPQGVPLKQRLLAMESGAQ